MSYNLGISFGRMCPDFSHPALVDAASGTAGDAGQPLEQTSPPAAFADVLSYAAEFYESIAALTSIRSFPRLGGSGMMAGGHFWTLNISVLHSADSAYSACSLGAILEPPERVPPRYWLSPRACRGILSRAERRGKKLPPLLQQALEATAAALAQGEPSPEP